jgi:hypothetical protein
MKLKGKFIVCDKCKTKFLYPTGHGNHDFNDQNLELAKWIFCPFCGRELPTNNLVNTQEYEVSDPKKILGSFYSFAQDRGYIKPLRKLTLNTLWDYILEKYKFVQDIDAQLAYLEDKDAWRNRCEPW